MGEFELDPYGPTHVRSYAVREFQSATGNIEPDRITCTPLMHKEGHCLFGGDTLIVEDGCYRATFEISIDPYQFAENPLVVLDVYENLRTKTVLAERQIQRWEIGTNGPPFSIDFVAYQGDRVEFRVFWREQCFLVATGLVLEKLDRAISRNPTVDDVQFFERVWPLTDVRIGRVLQHRDGRLVRELSAAEGKFVFKIADPCSTVDKIERDVFVFDFLKEKGFQNIPKLVRTKEGRGHYEGDGTFISVMECVRGKPMEHTPANWRRLGQIAAKLHSFTEYPLRTEFTVGTETDKMIANAATFPFETEYLECLRGLPSFEGLSESLIHTDMGPNNTIEGENRDLILVDWDHAGQGLIVLEIGFPLVCHFVTSDLQFEAEKAGAYYGAYFAHQSLPERDRARIFDAGLFCALMYVPYGDVENNWERVKFAMRNRASISSILE